MSKISKDEKFIQIRSMIMNEAYLLFCKHGFDAVSLDDIANAVGIPPDTIKNYVFSKEEILNVLMTLVFHDNVKLDEINTNKSFTGLDKIKELHRMIFDNRQLNFNEQLNSATVLLNPVIAFKMINDCSKVIYPIMKDFTEEGVRDGSIPKEYNPDVLAQFISLLLEMWSPVIFASDASGIFERIDFCKTVFDKLGIPLMDDTVMAALKGAVLQ